MEDLVTCIEGTVVKGHQIGRTLGFPTANLVIHQRIKDNLKRGVYGVNVYYDQKNYYRLMNVGVRLTFKGGSPTVSYEVHILNFHKEIYGELLRVDILFFIREEQAFHSKDQLIQQLNLDVQQCDEQFSQLIY